SKECPKPRDYSRVECRNCGEKGHTAVRCKQPKPEDGEGFGDSGGFGAAAAAGGGWDTGGAVDAAASGGWDNGGGGVAAVGDW
ncbi:hypothetical protein K402DRAFT_375542, partial [Aulographum hederae CBS 113979]